MSWHIRLENWRRARRVNRKGFTLVELLVVISIITLLIAILLPALTKARQQANNISCMAKMRQIENAMVMYVNDNQGYLPYSYAPPYYQNSAANGAEGVYGDWSYLLTAEMLGGTGYESDTNFTNKTLAFRQQFFTDVDTAYVAGDALDYSAHPRLLPEINDGLTTTSSSYDFSTGGQYPFYKLVQVQNQANIVMIMDAVQSLPSSASATAKDIDKDEVQSGGGYLLTAKTGAYELGQLFDAGTNQDGPGTGFQSSQIRWRHLNNNSANFLFVDGHVESRFYNSEYTSEVSLLNFDVNTP